jgi:hypothetical protein
MAMRDVGLYAWTLPHIKDPQGSTMKIMRRESCRLGRKDVMMTA